MDVPVLSRLNTRIRTTLLTRELGIDALKGTLETYLPRHEIYDVVRAYNFSFAAHEGQTRKTGEAYIFHPLAAARILAEMRLDYTTLMAVLLHDVVEDCDGIELEDIGHEFGPEVATIVDGVSKLNRASDQTQNEARAKSIRKLLLAMTQDLRVILVKLADRLHNMRTLGAMPDKKRRRIAQETLDIYAPIAQRLGIYKFQRELEDLGLANLYPKRFEVLTKSVASISGKRKNMLREVERKLSEKLKEEGISATVVGRQKNIFSIYRKMKEKNLKLLQVMDLYGFRIIVDRVDDCYRALGIAHHTYRPISEEFDDFIANAKMNGYQSLHTTLIGPAGVKIEVQIRTRDMHHVAEAGIAAHWQYKIGATSASKTPQIQAREWLSNVMAMEEGAANTEDFIEHVKVDLYPDEVYVFTPKGQIHRLPRGATPIDFAYSVHTELGNRCVAARVDHNLVPVSEKLKNGQQVEIITSSHSYPNATWLNFVRSAKARASIRNYLKNLQDDEAKRLGRRLLEKSLREIGVSPRRLRGSRVNDALAELNEPSMEELYRNVGLGNRMAPLAARHFLPTTRKSVAATAMPLEVEGTEGLVVEYGRCCHPVPGDAIRGLVDAGRGIVIHRNRCKRKAGKDEWVEVTWAPDVSGDFLVELRLKGEDRRGLLAQVAKEIAESGSNIESVRSITGEGRVADLRFSVLVRDKAHLTRLIRRTRRLEVVEDLTRH